MVSRRDFIGGACAAAWIAADGARAASPSATDLKSITGAAQPISAEERRGRIAKLQSLMTQQKIGALLVESGSTLEYFTGIRWHRSERTTAALIPASGTAVVVTPAFEEPSVRETLQVGGDVRPWNEPESPFELIVQGLRDRGAAAGVIAVEPTMRFFIVDGIRRALKSTPSIVTGDMLVRACR